MCYISTNDVFFAVKTSPNMIGLTKKYHNQETTEKKFKVPGVLFCTIFSMWTGWFIDVPP